MGQTQFRDHEPSASERAFIYQQINELNEFAPGIGTVIFLLEETVDAQPKRFAVTVATSPNDIPVKAREEGDSFYQAILAAKDQVKKDLAALFAAGAIEIPEDEETEVERNSQAAH